MSMKMIKTVLMALMCLGTLVACNDYETYGDKKDKERKAIRQFISDSSIVVISETQFHQQGNVTDTARNEFVYMDNTGVYMQIVREGCGTALRDGETSDLLVRFMELSIIDTTVIYNDVNPYDVDIMNVRRTGNTFTCSFTSGAWYATYGANVPEGLIIPLSYLNLGRPRTADDRIAKVRLIVPHTRGHSIATQQVYPYYYEISLQRKNDL